MKNNLFIAGIRHKIKSDVDMQRTAIFTEHVLKYLQIAAFLGVIFPVLITVDYFLPVKVKTEIILHKRHRAGFYYILMREQSITVNQELFYHIVEGSPIDFCHTVIFKTLVRIIYQDGSDVYISKPLNIYGWPSITAVFTFLFSIFLLLKNRPNPRIDQDVLVTVGVINAFLCIFTIAFTVIGANR
jgi:hypothetical protein